MALITALVTSPVPAVPPTSGVRMPAQVVRSTAVISASAADFSPRNLSISAAVQKLATGLRFPCPRCRMQTRDGLEHGGKASLRANVRGRRDTEAARQRAREIGQDIRMQVGGDNGVEALGIQRHSRRHCIDQHLCPGDIGVFAGNFGSNLIPHDHSVPLGIGLGDHGEQFSRPRLRHPECVTHDSGDPGTGEERHIRGDFLGWPRCALPPMPEYSPSLFSRMITQSRSPGLQFCNGEEIPGKTRVGRTLAY